MRARRVGPGGARPEGDDVLFVTPDRAVAMRLRARHQVTRVVVAADPLPFAEGVFDELVDEAAVRPEVVAEDARVVREGGKVVLVADARGAGALAVVRLWKKGPPPLAATDASAWLLGAGCEELLQTAPREGLVVTEGRVRTRVRSGSALLP